MSQQLLLVSQPGTACRSSPQAGTAWGTGDWDSPPSLPALAKHRGTCTVSVWGLPRLWQHVGVEKFVEAETKPRKPTKPTQQ